MYLTRKVGPKGQVVIPEELRSEFGIAPGSEVFFDTDGKRIFVSVGLSGPSGAVEDFLAVGKRCKNLRNLSAKRLKEILAERFDEKYGLH